MPRVAPLVPAETDILCESCGYTLNGLPGGGNCPECGQPVAVSTFDSSRKLPAWEESRSIGAFFRTTLVVLFHPTRFYRTITTRGEVRDSNSFANVHWIITALLLGVAGYTHIVYLSGAYFGSGWSYFGGCALFAVTIWIALLLTTRLAAKLTAWEAAYRGFRLPIAAVRRGLNYHAPHYTPVAAIVLLTVLAYYYVYWEWSFRRGWALADRLYFYYLVSLCAEIVLGAFFLFWTYWIAMRNMMYANR